MRRLFVAGNWKMHTTAAEAVARAVAVAAGGADVKADLAVMPPYVYLAAVIETVRGSPVTVGAQNMYCEPEGAFTGEISVHMLKDIGCRFVILGHSERRHVFGEADDLINQKVVAALAAGVNPILCIGEKLEAREAGRTLEVCEAHVTRGLAGVAAADMARVTIAYEPVWAIGTGKTATPEQAQQVHAEVRALVARLYDARVAQAVRIQYGGSVKPENAAAILSQPDVDGALVGGASLKADAFLAIARAGDEAA